MTVDSIRSFCLSFPQAKEKLQWGEALCFKISGRIFAVLNLGSVPPRLSLKCNPEKFAELVEQEDIIPAPYLGRYKWVALQRLDALPVRELEDLIQQSYEMVSAKVVRPKRVRQKAAKKKAKTVMTK